MYEYILNADLVITDLSTSNVNAAYELGVRHALRKRPTIIVAENQWDFPFDINRNAIRTYEHLGPDLGRQEARRFSKELSEAISVIVNDQAAVDSPLYTFIPELMPPGMRAAAPGQRMQAAAFGAAETEAAPTVKVLTDQARVALHNSDFVTAKAMLQAARGIRPNDEYILQKLVLATYKSKLPNEADALQAALALLLETLDPLNSNDPESIGLWAAVHKRLWSINQQTSHLEASIDGLERGFKLKNDYYNGINLAYLLNERAQIAGTGPAEAIADYVLAQRIRRKVIVICQARLDAGSEDPAESYWVLASLWEAAVGLDDQVAAGNWAQAAAEHVAFHKLPGWMVDSTREQLDKLSELLSPSPLRHLAD